MGGMKHRPAPQPVAHEPEHEMMPSLESILGHPPVIAPQASDFDIPTVQAGPADVSGVGAMYGYGPDATSAPRTAIQQAARDALPEDPYFQAMAAGGKDVKVREGWLPDEIKVPKEIIAGIDERYNESAKHGNYERGGNLVQDGKHHYKVRPGGTNADDIINAGGGHEPDGDDKGAWMADSDDVGKHEQLLGTVHTHIYDKPGVTGTFSGEDISGLARDNERMSFIRTGDDYAMIAKTKEFADMEAAATKDDDAEGTKEQAFKDGMSEQYNEAYLKMLKGGMSVRDASEATTKWIARQYHLAYYEGHGQQLKRAK